MTDIDSIKLRRLDLTVLLVFLGLLRHRKATAVAAEMGLTQSSISHALRRLRDVFGDELLLRRPHGFEPTAVALALEPIVRRVVEDLSDALAGPPSFVPASFDGVVRIGAFDNELTTLLPPLIRIAGTEAPGMRISARSVVRKAALDALAGGDLELALGYFRHLGPDDFAETLYEETFLVVGRGDDPAMLRGLTLESYAAARHVIMSPVGDLSGAVDTALAAVGASRTVVAALPLFFPVFAAVAETGCLATVPRLLAARYAPTFGLVTAEPPVAVPGFGISAVRHRRDARNPLHDWLIGHLRAVVARCQR